ncbi:hypothetical protein GE09DRAFT_1064929 [Coniochaeta sp. 2T2.1]|nr:hypothetical protein GE09DRAFT_1064929 [Coniochaeta sp. 2T2.1]
MTRPPALRPYRLRQNEGKPITADNGQTGFHESLSQVVDSINAFLPMHPAPPEQRIGEINFAVNFTFNFVWNLGFYLTFHSGLHFPFYCTCHPASISPSTSGRIASPEVFINNINWADPPYKRQLNYYPLPSSPGLFLLLSVQSGNAIPGIRVTSNDNALCARLGFSRSQSPAAVTTADQAPLRGPGRPFIAELKLGVARWTSIALSQTVHYAQLSWQQVLQLHVVKLVAPYSQAHHRPRLTPPPRFRLRLLERPPTGGEAVCYYLLRSQYYDAIANTWCSDSVFMPIAAKTVTGLVDSVTSQLGDGLDLPNTPSVGSMPMKSPRCLDGGTCCLGLPCFTTEAIDSASLSAASQNSSCLNNHVTSGQGQRMFTPHEVDRTRPRESMRSQLCRQYMDRVMWRCDQCRVTACLICRHASAIRFAGLHGISYPEAYSMSVASPMQSVGPQIVKMPLWMSWVTKAPPRRGGPQRDADPQRNGGSDIDIDIDIDLDPASDRADDGRDDNDSAGEGSRDVDLGDGGGASDIDLGDDKAVLACEYFLGYDGPDQDHGGTPRTLGDSAKKKPLNTTRVKRL